MIWTRSSAEQTHHQIGRSWRKYEYGYSLDQKEEGEEVFKGYMQILSNGSDLNSVWKSSFEDFLPIMWPEEQLSRGGFGVDTGVDKESFNVSPGYAECLGNTLIIFLSLQEYPPLPRRQCFQHTAEQNHGILRLHVGPR